MGTKCTVGTHATFIPPEDHRDKKRAVLDSQAAVLKWMIDFPRDDTDREDGSGLEFECLLNTGGWWVRARAKEFSRLCIQCGRAWSVRQVDPEGWCASCRKDKHKDANRNDTATARHIGLLVRLALPEELNLMAAGEDVKETVMTIPFLQTCIINMIVDLEKRFTSDGNKTGALVQPKAPWKWFTSYELGFPLVSDEHDRPMHPLVETFVEYQSEAHWAEEEEALRPFLPSSVNSRH